jgi:hypothetical protein
MILFNLVCWEKVTMLAINLQKSNIKGQQGNLFSTHHTNGGINHLFNKRAYSLLCVFCLPVSIWR